MDNEPIENATRVIGKDQGFVPLSVRDEVHDYGPTFGHVPVMVTQWRPTADELAALIAGAPVFLSLWGVSWPPAMLTVELPPAGGEAQGHG